MDLRPVRCIPRPKFLMIRFMTGILSIHRVIRSILHLSEVKFQDFPRIITSISFSLNSCLKATSIYYPGPAFILH